MVASISPPWVSSPVKGPCTRPGCCFVARSITKRRERYDIMEYIVRDRMGIYRGSHGAHIQNVTRTMFRT